ncbi:MAG TPA: YihY/virulence factor BrkB family protein [Micromonosporaceae bacterium]
MRTLVRGANRLQQRRAWLAFPLAVYRKYSDDQAANLAALIAYFAFVSVFPLLLVFVTVLGFAARGNPGLYHRLLNSALVEFPVIGTQLRVNGLHGSWGVFVVGSLIAWWGARGVANAAQTALNEVWDVPHAQRPGFFAALPRSLGFLLTIGASVIITGTLSGLSGAGSLGVAVRIGAFTLSLAINIGLFLLAFRLSTAKEVATRDLVLGAAISAVLWQILLAVGALLVAHQVRHAQSLYGVFGVVLGLLAWLQLQAQITLYAAEIDVVRARRLWPRSVAAPPLTPADRHAYTGYAQAERRLPADEQRVAVHFPDQDDARPEG